MIIKNDFIPLTKSATWLKIFNKFLAEDFTQEMRYCLFKKQEAPHADSIYLLLADHVKQPKDSIFGLQVYNSCWHTMADFYSPMTLESVYNLITANKVAEYQFLTPNASFTSFHEKVTNEINEIWKADLQAVRSAEQFKRASVIWGATYPVPTIMGGT